MIKQYPLSFMTLLLNLYAISRMRNACLVYFVTAHQLLFSHLRLTTVIFHGGNGQTIRMGKLKSKSLKEA